MERGAAGAGAVAQTKRPLLIFVLVCFSKSFSLDQTLRTGSHSVLTPCLPALFHQCKLGIVRFIEAKQVPELETVVHLVVASSDTRHSVATAADLELKSKQR